MGKPKDESGAAVAEAPTENLQTSVKADGPEFSMIAVKDLAESRFNQRKTFNPTSLKEMSESIKQKGVLEPLLVRKAMKTPGPDFEIVAGHRRFRGAKLAGLKEVPCLVRFYTDIEVLEINVIENGQRDDVPPLEEGEGYKQLMDTAKYDVATIAKKVGKSGSYVYARMQLAKLIDPAKKALTAGVISAGHAEILCRLQREDQEKALKLCVQDCNVGDWQSTIRDKVVVSVRGLAAWIARNIHCNLDGAPWKKDDAALCPKAGACDMCPKRGGNPLLDIKSNICTDPACFNQKAEAFIQQKKAEIAAATKSKVVEVRTEYSGNDKEHKEALGKHDYEVVKPGTKGAVQAVVIDGKEFGQVKTVKPRDSEQERKQSKQREERYKADQRAAAKKHKAEQAYRKALVKAVADKAPESASTALLKIIACAAADLLRGDGSKALFALKGWEPNERSWYEQYSVDSKVEAMAGAELVRFLVELAVISDQMVPSCSSSKPERLLAIAKLFKVDPAKVREDAKPKEKVKIRVGGKTFKVDKITSAPVKGAKAKGKPPTPAEVSKVMKAEKKKLEQKGAKKGKRK